MTDRDERAAARSVARAGAREAGSRAGGLIPRQGRIRDGSRCISKEVVNEMSGAKTPSLDPKEVAQQIRDLTMMLLYLTRWTEDKPKKLPPGTRVAWCSWKGHDWDALDRLKADGLIDFSHRTKSVVLSQKGEKAAQQFLKKYGLRTK